MFFGREDLYIDMGLQRPWMITSKNVLSESVLEAPQAAP